MQCISMYAFYYHDPIHQSIGMIYEVMGGGVSPTKTCDKAKTSTKLMSLLLQQGVEKIDRLRHGEGFSEGA